MRWNLDIFISLTGWSFATLLAKEREHGGEDAEEW
jgi:hypothetical protein